MIDNLVLLVELPPYSTPEGVMMAEKLPNLVWLANTGTARASRIGAQVAALRRSHPGLMGAVLNRVERAATLPLILLFLALAAPVPGAPAADEPVPPPELAKPAGTLSITSPEQMAAWQKKLTLGPGDVLDISLYGQPDSTRQGLIIGPDGRLNYLQARDVMAAGLTVDELRAELEKVLAKYQLAPQIVINPVAYRSKRYFLLGSVNARGVYTLDRPTTIIEAVAKGRGFINVIQQQNPISMVDLSRSFLVRKGEDGSFARVPVDFESLFLRGDLSQNLALQPEDYLFFPTLAVQEVYVVGEVRAQGVVPLNREMTAMGAIIARGGFTERAWKSKILVVRGSMIKPEMIPVNAADILKAQANDLKLHNRDIIYVHMKPWAKAEELLESAIYSFAQAVAMGYVNQNIIPYKSSSFSR